MPRVSDSRSRWIQCTLISYIYRQRHNCGQSFNLVYVSASTHSTSSSVFILLSFAKILQTKHDSYNQSGGIYYKVTAASSALCVNPLIWLPLYSGSCVNKNRMQSFAKELCLNFSTSGFQANSGTNSGPWVCCGGSPVREGTEYFYFDDIFFESWMRL